MSNSFETLNELLKSHNMTVADLEYIVRYLTNENISPQLAMRRIKSFQALQTKLEDTSDQEAINELKGQIQEIETEYQQKLSERELALQEIKNQKDSIESEKTELENLSDLFESEREELKNQLNLLQEMQEVPSVSEPISSTNSDDKLIENMARFQIDLQDLVRTKSELQNYIGPISDVLESLIENPEKYDFNQNKFLSQLPVEKVITSPKETVEFKEVKSTPVVKASAKVTTTTPAKKIKPGPSQQVLQVLNLFLDFVGEAKNDKDFRNRVETVCDMDEAYEHLGGIGLSQIYSFATQGISKKEELIQLINAWKIDGVPR